ncbi:phage/plasmid-like protein (TIGR03299 family) [Chitinophaga terrae (ex Kim and Jung 2007)]|uniref:DUF932 domain-containing protein n=1 Tax=Chitinophaga terrae (ex Kim and Jung 2007) TaxID=408074 RepID=UPI00277EA1B2|nr:DUF932 domain-containing protein [Chitinophaga terrae (ex Kim and Jung 2007)]MDQ0107477.1 phage/plasmid-like protein (TIGR03299 family) [Chitinophaga terrae (ex Kim and Jung 2007)]
MHNLNYNEKTGKYSFYSVNEIAWHGLGHIAGQYENSAAVLENAGLNFSVYKLPNIHRLPDGNEIVSQSSFFTYRGDTGQILGDRLGIDYQVVQNHEAFTFFDEIAGKDGIYYETAGALGNGERIFITAKLPSYIKVGNDDIIEKYLFLTASHDGKGSITAAFTPVRIVCNNTLNAALANCENMKKIRHTAGAAQRLKEAHKVMEMVNTLAPQMEQLFNSWAKVRITDAEVKKLIAMAMAPTKEVLANVKAERWDEVSTAFKNIADDVFSYAMMSDTQQLETTKGTLFGAYNSITGYFQNVKKYDNTDDKLKSVIYGGTGQQRTQSAFDLCTAYQKDGADIFKMN